MLERIETAVSVTDLKAGPTQRPLLYSFSFPNFTLNNFMLFFIIVCFSFIINNKLYLSSLNFSFTTSTKTVCLISLSLLSMVCVMCLELDLPCTHMFVVICYTCATTTATPPTNCTVHVNTNTVLIFFLAFIIMIF